MAKLLPVQVLRAGAALSVATLHGLHELDLAGTGGGMPGWVRSLPWEAGVDVFFVISGFVMTVASRPLFGATGAARTFLARRVARIVPLYWLLTTLYLLVALAAPALLGAPAPSPGYVIASYLFVPAARADGIVQPLFSLGWTLNLEMMFYGLFAAAVGWRMERAVAAVALALVALVAFGGAAPLPISAWADPIVLEFVAGTLLGLLRVRGATLPMPGRIVLGAAGLALLAVVPALLAVVPAIDGGPLLRPLVYGLPGLCLVAACGLARAVPADRETAMTQWAALLGDASYAAYLVHPFVLRGCRIAAGRLGLADALGAAPFLALALLGTVAASIVVHLTIERPLTRAVRARLEPRPS